MKTSDSVLALVASMERARQRGTDDETAARFDRAEVLSRKLIDEVQAAAKAGMSTEDVLKCFAGLLGLLVKHATKNEIDALLGLTELFDIAVSSMMK